MQPKQPISTSILSTSQSQPSSGSFVDKLPGADWTNDIIALIVLLFTVLTYIIQQRQNRKAAAEQKEKDRLVSIEVERLRQQTIRLEWYPDIVRNKLDLEHVGELKRAGSRVNFVSTKKQSNDNAVATTDRLPVGNNIAFF
ncbi:hypothetical protein [Spirosoma panaciterrae]|uniref:hypothetical protein n=1 Tax=Spirosoma panaciterrae TaxID=496058 RepID=UPI0012FBD819|nr:hypothetical protein [Spirosoma panaciterrae]